MNCPKCYSVMEPVAYQGVEVDRCTGCRGLWFDLLEKEDLAERAGSEAVDTGDPETGKQYNQKERIRCPRDGASMLRMVDAAQPHVWYEMCPVCHGSFFDAGEFTDLKESGPLDVVRSLMTPERR